SCPFIIPLHDALPIYPMYQAFSSNGAWIQSLALCVPPDVLSGLTDANALSGPDMFSPLSLVEVQQLGGIIMMTVQQIIYTSMISLIVFRWFTAHSVKVDPTPGAGDLSYSVRHGE